MARIGLQNFLYGLLEENISTGEATYGAPRKVARAISCNVSITNNEAKLYADDVLAESDTSFASGTVSLGIDDEDMGTMAVLLGHEIVNGVMVRSGNDTAPYVGLGRIVVKLVSNVRKYKVEFISKVKFGEPSNEESTKGESLEFGTSTIEGTISALADGTWSKARTFDTMEEARTYLESLFGTGTDATVTYEYGDGTGTIEGTTTKVGFYIELPTAKNITAPTGKVFKGWSTESTPTTVNAFSPYKVNSATVSLYAVYEDN